MNEISSFDKFENIDIFKTYTEFVVSKKIINCIYDDIKDFITIREAIIEFNNIIYDGYFTFVVNNIGVFIETKGLKDYQYFLNTTLKKDYLNYKFDIAKDKSTNITIFSEKLVNKLKKYNVLFDLKKIPIAD